MLSRLLRAQVIAVGTRDHDPIATRLVRRTDAEQRDGDKNDDRNETSEESKFAGASAGHRTANTSAALIRQARSVGQVRLRPRHNE
jgi:hypothetical protein